MLSLCRAALIRVRKCGAPTVAPDNVHRAAWQLEEPELPTGRKAKNDFQATKHVSQFRGRSGHPPIPLGPMRVVTWRRSTAGGQRKLRRRISSWSMHGRARLKKIAAKSTSTGDQCHILIVNRLEQGRRHHWAPRGGSSGLGGEWKSYLP